VLIAAPAFAQDDQQDPAALRKKVDEFLKENPGVARDIRAQNIARENLEWMFRQDAANRGDEKNPRGDGAAHARAERAIKVALKVMTEAKKLKRPQAKELYELVFPTGTDWDARYEAFLKENLGVAQAVESGKINKEKVLAGIKSREGERPPTEEEQLEALYQRLLKEDRTLGRTPKAALMPRLKAMLVRGDGKNLRPEKSTRQRRMSFGLYFNELIESGQVERFDKDLKRVHDIGSAEISRQSQQKERGRAADRARGGRRRGANGRNRVAGTLRVPSASIHEPGLATAHGVCLLPSKARTYYEQIPNRHRTGNCIHSYIFGVCSARPTGSI